jgi:ubiquinone/menaquinone biosynthesis C-methylase UbiE
MPEPVRETYTHGHAESVLRSHRWRTAANSAAYLIPHLRPGLDLLDVGCGPATLTADLARLVAPGRVTAVDSAPDAVALAERELAGQALTGVEARVADAYQLPFPDATYDVVHAHQVLQHLGDPVAALTEWRRVVRPGGVVAARDSDYAGMTWWPQLPGLDDWMALYQQLTRHNGGEPEAGRRLLSWARAAGFSEVEPSASVWCFATDDDRRWWGGLWAERARHSAYAEQSLALGMADQARLDRIAAAWQDWASAPDGWFVIVHGEVLAHP